MTGLEVAVAVALAIAAAIAVERFRNGKSEDSGEITIKWNRKL